MILKTDLIDFLRKDRIKEVVIVKPRIKVRSTPYWVVYINGNLDRPIHLNPKTMHVEMEVKDEAEN